MRAEISSAMPDSAQKPSLFACCHATKSNVGNLKERLVRDKYSGARFFFFRAQTRLTEVLRLNCQTCVSTKSARVIQSNKHPARLIN